MKDSIARRRLLNQALVGTSPFKKPAEVVRYFGAVQAQDYAAAKWAVGQRISGAVEQDVERAYDAGEILRTHMMRPTWHFVTPEDIGWMLALTSPHVEAFMLKHSRRVGLDAKTFARGEAAIAKALQGEKYLTRDELRDVLERARISTAGQRTAYMLMVAELAGTICSGPRRGKQFTYALLDERVAPRKKPTRDDALAELALRFFRSHGPATVDDLAKWSGLKKSEARAGVEDARKNLHGETIEGKTYWSAGGSAAKTRGHTAHLLSLFDEFVIGYDDRSAIVTPEFGKKLFSMGAALTAVVVVEGRLVGHWRRTLKKETVEISAKVFRKLTPAEGAALHKAADRYGKFLGLTASLTTASA